MAEKYQESSTLFSFGSVSASVSAMSGDEGSKCWMKFIEKIMKFWISDVAEICVNELREIARESRCRINNGKDKFYQPLPKKEIVARACSEIGKRKYNLLHTNCEHFATWCRFGTKSSSQVWIKELKKLRIFFDSFYLVTFFSPWIKKSFWIKNFGLFPLQNSDRDFFVAF